MLLGGMAGLAGMTLPASAAPNLQVPQGPMSLTRKLVRQLSDGNEIRVSRSWQISFLRQKPGLAVVGSQINVDVDAPTRLAAIASIERERSTESKFPILLDGSGLIVSAGEAENASDVEGAIRVALQTAAKGGASLTQQQQLRAALARVQAAGTTLLERLPPDLFFPRNSGFVDKREIGLPDGSVGEFEVSYSVISQPLSGLLDRADRHIVTRVGGSEQMSSEHWEMRAI